MGITVSLQEDVDPKSFTYGRLAVVVSFGHEQKILMTPLSPTSVALVLPPQTKG